MTDSKAFTLVTGASSGIGSDLARVFAREGRPLLLVARSQERLTALAEKLKAAHGVEVEIFSRDLSQPGAAKSLASDIGSKGWAVDTLVNNAGFGLLGPFAELDAERQDEMIRLNVLTLTELTRRLLPAMLKRGAGRVLNVASTAAFQPGPSMAVYFATKAYVLSFSVALSEELRGTGVTVTCLCPGPTDTRFAETAEAADARLFQSRRPMTSRQVAEEAYLALNKGKAYRITGWVNRWMALGARLAPPVLAARLAKVIMGTPSK